MASRGGGIVYDVVVVGAGIEGSSSAYNLVKEGKRVLLLEQFSLPHSRGSSHGQSRITRYAYTDEFYVRMMVDAFPMWETLEQESGEDFFVNCGVIDIRQEGPSSQLVASALQAHNIPHEVLTAKAFRDQYPIINAGDKCGAVFDPSGGLLRADRALRAFQTVFKKRGGIIKDGCPVTSIIPGDIAKVITPKGVFAAKNVVIAAGAWSGRFAKALGLDIPLQPIKVLVLYWKVCEEKLSQHTSDCFPCFLDSTNAKTFETYGIPCDDYPGLVKVCLHTGPPIDPDHRDQADTEWVEEATTEEVKQKFPWLANKPSVREYCIYTMTPDSHPFIDCHPKYPNIVIAAGFSGHGFKLSPAVGKAVKQLVLKQPKTYNMKPFSLSRFNHKAKL